MIKSSVASAWTQRYQLCVWGSLGAFLADFQRVYLNFYRWHIPSGYVWKFQGSTSIFSATNFGSRFGQLNNKMKKKIDPVFSLLSPLTVNDDIKDDQVVVFRNESHFFSRFSIWHFVADEHINWVILTNWHVFDHSQVSPPTFTKNWPFTAQILMLSCEICLHMHRKNILMIGGVWSHILCHTHTHRVHI